MTLTSEGSTSSGPVQALVLYIHMTKWKVIATDLIHFDYLTLASVFELKNRFPFHRGRVEA